MCYEMFGRIYALNLN